MDKIRVLYICVDPGLGGSTRSLLNLIESVKENVYPIVLFPEDGPGYNLFITKGIESYSYPFIKLHYFKSNKLKDVLKHPWDWHYFHKMSVDLGCYIFVKEILAGRHISIIHSNASPNDIGVFLSKKFHAKHVWHIREFCDLDFNYDIYRGMSRLRKLINNADARIAISSAIKDHWQMTDINTWIINNAIQSQRNVCHILDKKKYILYCSNFLTEAKGARFTITAFGKSKLFKEGYHLKMVGCCDSDYHKTLMQTANEYGCLDFVDFIPYQDDLKPYYSYASAFIMASVYEGLGRVTAEAMFYGCPVVARASGGTLDLVENGFTGWLFNTEEECAKIMNQICHDSQTKIIMNAQQFAINNLSTEVYAPKILSVYNKILNGH